MVGRRLLATAFATLLGCAAPPPGRDGAEPRPVDLAAVPVDLVVPPVSAGPPAPGRRVRITAPEYRGTAVHHLLYLPTDWQPGRRWPVLVEYAGNGPYANRFGDRCSGRVDGSSLGFGISGGTGFLWVCLPYVARDGQHNATRWWGDLERTVAYCKTVVPRICAAYGGDPQAVFLLGFSRGAIACNYVGLHDDEIAGLWRGFVCHSHYDGVRRWGYPNDDRRAAGRRLQRLGDRPQWISHELSVDETRRYLEQVAPGGRFTCRPLPYRNHTDTWVLRDLPLRAALRRWIRAALPARRP